MGEEEEDGGVSTKDMARQSSGGDVSLTQLLSSPQSPQQSPLSSSSSPSSYLATMPRVTRRLFRSEANLPRAVSTPKLNDRQPPRPDINEDNFDPATIGLESNPGIVRFEFRDYPDSVFDLTTDNRNIQHCYDEVERREGGGNHLRNSSFLGGRTSVSLRRSPAVRRKKLLRGLSRSADSVIDEKPRDLEVLGRGCDVIALVGGDILTQESADHSDSEDNEERNIGLNEKKDESMESDLDEEEDDDDEEEEGEEDDDDYSDSSNTICMSSDSETEV